MSTQGSSKFRTRTAREATKQGIAAEGIDLASVVEDERGRMARGESPSGTERERPDAQDEAKVEQDLRR
jgi:hypothetical protein